MVRGLRAASDDTGIERGRGSTGKRGMERPAWGGESAARRGAR